MWPQRGWAFLNVFVGIVVVISCVSPCQVDECVMFTTRRLINVSNLLDNTLLVY